MKYRIPARLLALSLALAAALSPAAQALTTEQAGKLLEAYYIDDVPEEVLAQPTIQAMLEALGDPYTQYFTAEEYALFSSSMSDTELVGIGISSLITGDGPLIQHVYADTPAAGGGLLAGDLITAVDGTATAGLDADTVTGLLRGEPGTRVELTYLRGGESRTVTLTRRPVTIPTAYAELLDNGTGYIVCDSFGAETAEHFAEGLETYGEQADLWIVDLRGNGGGVVDTAVDAVNLFVGPGVLACLEDSDGSYGVYVREEEALTDAPVIVLTDANTASASELFAADVRDSGAGLVVGSRTFGKGVAQLVLTGDTLPGYFDDGDAMKVTTYRFYSPNGVTTDTVGVFPHLLVDADLADETAALLTPVPPEEADETWLRIDLSGTWYVSLAEAAVPERAAALTALLEALPDGTLSRGSAGGWEAVTPAETAADCGLSAYRDRSFSDTASSPHAAQIDLLALYGVLSGPGDGTYRPEEGLTRAELCAMLAKALNCRVPTGGSAFSDVSMDDWYGQCVNAVARLGLVDGVGGERFDPDGAVTREQLITILARLGRRLSMELEETALDMPAGAAEGEAYRSYAPWAREGAWLLSGGIMARPDTPVNLLWADPAEITPAGAATRGEAAALLCNLLTYLGILPS